MKNLNNYIKKLEKSLEDKLFFLKHIDINDYSLVVEFGCANGRLLRRIEPVIDKEVTKLVGFDINEEIIEIAKMISPEITFLTKWDEVLDILKNTTKKSLIIFSSVWHEINPQYYEKIFNLCSCTYRCAFYRLHHILLCTKQRKHLFKIW